MFIVGDYFVYNVHREWVCKVIKVIDNDITYVYHHDAFLRDIEGTKSAEFLNLYCTSIPHEKVTEEVITYTKRSLKRA